MDGSTTTAKGTFSPLGVRRKKTAGFVKSPDRGIRLDVVAMLAAAGAAGVSCDEVAGAWPAGRGTADKVSDCMGILAGDEYGYEVERLSHPVSRGEDRYRLRPGSQAGPAGAGAAAAAGSSGPAGHGEGGAATAAGSPPPPELSPEEAQAALAAKIGALEPDVRDVVLQALKSPDPRKWVKDNVPEDLKARVRAAIKSLR